MLAQMNAFRTHRAISWFYALIFPIILFFIIFGTQRNENIGVSLLIAVAVICLFFLHHLIAISCKRGERRGRIASIIVSCLMLPMTPIGLMIGAWLLFNTWQPWSKIDN